MPEAPGSRDTVLDPATAPPATAPAARPRRLDLDRAKGIAILLVVFGHLVARQAPPGVEWYEPVRYLVYRFHMPFFLYLSGTVVMLAGTARVPPAAWPGFLRRRAVRLLVPFFAVGLLILGAKLAATQVVHVDNRPHGLAGGLTDLFWSTGQSPATSIWYLLVLFLCTVVALPVLRLRGGTTALVLLGVALQVVELPPVAYLDRFGNHFLFFAAGCWVAEREAWLLPAFDRWPWPWWGLLGMALALAAMGWLDARWSMVACGLLSIPALHGAMRRWPVDRLRWPLVLGRYGMAVYLFNTMAIGLAKAALLAVGIGWTAAAFGIHVVVLMLAGVALPILLKRLVLRRVPTLNRMTD